MYEIVRSDTYTYMYRRYAAAPCKALQQAFAHDSNFATALSPHLFDFADFDSW